MRGERRNHSLQATALVHEVYLRLVDQDRADWKNRAQFFGVAAQMMRRVLVDHARNRGAAKRRGSKIHVYLTVAAVGAAPEQSEEILAVDTALRTSSPLLPWALPSSAGWPIGSRRAASLRPSPNTPSGSSPTIPASPTSRPCRQMATSWPTLPTAHPRATSTFGCSRWAGAVSQSNSPTIPPTTTSRPSRPTAGPLPFGLTATEAASTLSLHWAARARPSCS